MAEDRELFKQAMARIGLACPRSQLVSSVEEARACLDEIGFPAILRPSFTLGGSGGGIAYNRGEFDRMVQFGLDQSPVHSILIEESVLGWKEFELEVVRDAKDNAVIVCSIENLDPMGVHTGDSITVAPAMTLDRQGVPAHARRLDRDHARDRRDHRRLATCSSRSIRRPGGCS